MPQMIARALRYAGVVTLSLGILACVLFANARAANAQAVPKANPVVVVVPYEEPGTKDPHALGVTQAFLAALQEQNIVAKPVAAMDHLDAVAQAGKLCSENSAAALLIVEGRYEQSEKNVMLPFGFHVISYPTHVEVRLDQIDCRGVVAWSTRAVGDQSQSGLGYSIIPGAAGASNVGSIIDDCFKKAIKGAVADLVQAPALPAIVSAGVAVAAAPAPAPSTPVAPSGTYLLLPFAQPGIADPRSPDMTGSLAKALAARNVIVKNGEPIDRLTTLATASALCTQYGVGGIIVPSIRVERTTKTFGDLRLDLVGCDGRLLARGTGTGNTGGGGQNPSAAMVEVSEKATPDALDALFPTTKTAAAQPGKT